VDGRVGPGHCVASSATIAHDDRSGSQAELADAAAREKVGARHVILYLQRPTIEKTPAVIRRFGEEVVRKL
jgi:hypothetical protein